MYRNVSVFLLTYLLLICVQCCGTLLQIPKNVRLDSQLTVVRSGKTEDLMVEEFVDKKESNVHIKVVDKSNKLTSYYRIGDETDSTEFFAPSLVMYDHSEGLCRNEQTTNWRLKELSDYLSLLYKSPELETRTIREDRTSLGPLALLEVLYENSLLFILKTSGFDEIRMSEMHYFEANFSVSDTHIVRLICLIPSMNTLTKRSELLANNTTLSKIETNVHPYALAMVKLPKGDLRLALNARTLLNTYINQYDAILISLQSVQERSMSKHLGLAPGSYDEQNPFTMPPGAGCGAIANRNLLYISAQQFSGIFEAKDFETESYVAYDSRTSQLRIDSIGEYKLIYKLNTRRLILISDQTTQPNQSGSSSASAENGTRCAQTYVNGDDSELDTKGVESMEDLLGVGKYVALMFLGSELLEDKTRCLVFEREISARKIPFLVKLNLRLKPRPTDRFFLVYHFVNQLAANETFEFGPNSYKSMWLKRLDLLSSSSLISKYTILNSQLTFDEFTWTLESVAEDTQDRESKLLHPARTFDIAECKSIDDLTEIEFVVKESPSSDWNSVGIRRQDSEQPPYSLNEEFLSQLNVLEEELVVYTSKRLGVARSQISDFELFVPGSTANGERFMLAKATLVEFPHFTFELNLVGWIANVRSIEFSERRKWIKTQISRYECSLIMATMERAVARMFYCPNYGCGERDSSDSIGFAPKTEKQLLPPFEDTFEMCEVYELNRKVDLVVSERFVKTRVQQGLDGAEVSFDLPSQQSTESLVFRGEIVKVSVAKGLSSQSLGRLVMADRCFTNKTSLVESSSNSSNSEVDILELQFEQHHSEAFCHKACHLYPNCQTYSYSASSNVCTLTNIHKRYIFGPTDALTEARGPNKLTNLREEPGCRIYALSSLSLYSVNPVSDKVSLDGMSQGRVEYFYTLASLEECANLCRANELSLDSEIRCTGFWYFLMNSVCALEDKNSYLFQSEYASNQYEDDDLSGTKRDRKMKHFINLITEDEWRAYHERHAYDRDYEQYFIVEQSSRVKLQEPAEEVNLSGAAPTEQESPSRARAAGRVLYHLTNCLRECAILDPECVMVDYCTVLIESVPTKKCSLYHIRSPLLIEGPASLGFKLNLHVEQESASIEPALTDLELLYFMGGVSDKHNASVVPDGGCMHYYMTGDYLLLKRQMLERKLGEKQAAILNEIAARDLRESQSYLDLVKEFALSQSSTLVSDGMGLFSAILLLFAGISAGLLVSACGQAKNPISTATGMLGLSGAWDALANRSTSVLSRLAGTRGSSETSTTRVELADIAHSS